MRKLLLVFLVSFAMAGVANDGYAQHRGSASHGSTGFHGSSFHNGGFHRFHHGRFHNSFVFVAAPFFWGPGFYPYVYPYPYSVTSYDDLEPGLPYALPQQDYRYYCPNQGYYPSVQTCAKGWLRVIPDNPPGL